MKIKTIIVSILLSVLFPSILIITASCKNNDSAFLPYQNKSFFAKATIDINSEKFTADITKDSANNYKITFTSPEDLMGISIEKNSKSVYCKTGNISIPLPENSNISAYITDFFELKKNNMLSTKADIYNGVKTNITDFSCNFGKLKLYLSAENNTPLRMEAYVDKTPITVNISDFTITEE